ncbi:MAG: alginate lyase family protein [Prolixibacteraceae bacterium]|nr:alginate lyase family protein [Prolixibacteraceae bacterium]
MKSHFSKVAVVILMVWAAVFGAQIAVFAQTNWQQMQSVDDVCKAYPEKIQYIFLNLNLDYPGLQEVKKAYESNNIPQACKNLLNYYGNSNRILKDLPPVSQKSTTAADSILQDIYTFQNVSGQVPRLADGHLKWAHNGPENDIEWAWALNRHYPTRDLLDVYAETGNPKCAEYINQFTKDWIISSWPYPAKKSSTAMWRGLEVSFRVKMWSHVFFDLWNTRLISPATKLLILSSLPDHAHYARNFHAQGNWLTMEISGLATVASSWPELKESKAWMDYSIATMVASMKDQIYPDGVQTELTSSYHFVALSNFKLFADICRKNNVPLPEYYTKTLEDMYNYLALTMRPDGFGLLNNDADLMNNREKLLDAASEYKRKDWEYIVSNGKSGVKPNSGPSYVFPFAGQLISRSGFDADAHYSFFDIGPWGSGHQHNDKLHLSVTAYGRDLLVDGGRFAYRGEVANKFRKYAVGSASHNVILVDDNGQADGPKVAEAPLAKNLYAITPEYDYGSGIFEKFAGTEGKFSHTRSVVYVRGKFWVVADHLKTDRPRKIEAVWHWHPANQVQVQKSGIVATANERGNLQIIPVDASDWKVSEVKGQETPTIQGWYSKEYNTYEPNPTSIFSRQLKSDDTFVWILWPSEGKTPEIQTRILSKDAQSVKVRVTEQGKGSWEILVPFLNSKSTQVMILPNN